MRMFVPGRCPFWRVGGRRETHSQPVTVENGQLEVEGVLDAETL